MTLLQIKKIGWLFLPVMLFISSCTKTGVPVPPIDESQWLQQPRGVVVETGGFSCHYFILQNKWGYAVLRSYGSTPFPGSVIYGQHTSWGYNTFYSRSGGYLFRADVVDFGLSYFSALDQLQWYCGDPFGQ